MKVARWGDSLAVRIPADVVRTLGLQEGDEVDLQRIASTPSERTDEEAVLVGIRKLARPLPPGYSFDRDDANAR